VALTVLLASVLVAPPSATAAFGISAFTVTARRADGAIDESAASAPFALDVHLSMNRLPGGEPDGVLHAFQIDLPPGLVGSSLAIPRCSAAEFLGFEPYCGGATQVGALRADVANLGLVAFPIYNLEPAPGYAAAFGSALGGTAVTERLTVVADGSIRLSGTLPSDRAVTDVEEEIWGVPADPAHDPERICLGPSGERIEGCSAGVQERRLLSLPASCSAPLRSKLTVGSYGPPPVTVTATAFSRDAGGNPRPLIGCDAVPFDPRPTVATEGAALAPSAFKVGLEVPQYEEVGQTPAAPVAGLELELPAGLALNPAAGGWLTACSPAAIGLESAPGRAPAEFDDAEVNCPADSRLGSVTVQTPLVEHGLTGAIYLATPGENPSGARYAIYLVIEDEATGTILKIPGQLDADPVDGRLTASLPEMPPLPLSRIDLEMAGGPRAPLTGPPSCGRYAAEATFTPTSAPFAPTATRSSDFPASAGASGAPCPPPEAERPAAPSFHAGTDVARAGGESPLVIDLSRQDVDQHFGSFDVTLPPGLIGDLGSLSLGAAIGSVQVKAGLGPQPLSLAGTVYLGGPYKGAPYSLEIVVPAQAGPFDLGTIVQRAALEVDPVTAQISVRSDPLPQILGGVPLELRSLRLDLDRPGFIRNPTSCEPMAITGSATTSLGQSAPLSERFQVGDCAKLQFKPRLGLRFSGALGRNGHPAVRAVLSGNARGAALASVGFSLPTDELLDLRHLRGLCPRAVAADSCPGDSRLGTLRLESPFVDGAVEGPVYLRVPSHRLPDFTAELRSGRLRFVLHGRASDRGGRLGVSFGSLPDIPLSKAVLSLAGGRGGIVVNSRSLCSRPGTATATATAHNGMRRDLRIRPNLGKGC
jgi:hypothetical protein